VALRCRGSVAESVVYGASLSLWQRRVTGLADAFVVPSAFARGRLDELGAPLGAARRAAVVAHPVREFAQRSVAAQGGHALVASRLSAEKGVDVAIAAAARAGVPLVIAGDGPQAPELRSRARGAEVRFEGQVGPERLRELRAGAALAIVPSRSAETFGLAGAEAMAAGVPVVASRVGALPELVAPDGLVDPGDADGLAAAIERRYADQAAGDEGLRRVRELCSPATVAARLTRVYDEISPATAGP
jgi:glycosyltransferase involved in cell wall biosynthesis